ncbi:MAG: hypothetical protein DRP83_08495 [Planctomycetota bacterium]|nr:MAG: hypothetical protein DRP83_08495 [Planctomycetota bacterium]
MSQRMDSTEFASAVKTLKRARSFFSLLVALALLVQLGGFVMLYFFRETINVDALASFQQSLEAGKVVWNWHNVMFWAVNMSKLLALFSGCMVVAILAITNLVVIVGGGKGARLFITASLWSLLLLLLVSPWQDILRGGLLRGALYNLDTLRTWIAEMPGPKSGELKLDFHAVRFFAQFMGYPIISLLVLIMSLVRFGQGYRQIVAANRLDKQLPGQGS